MFKLICVFIDTITVLTLECILGGGMTVCGECLANDREFSLHVKTRRSTVLDDNNSDTLEFLISGETLFSFAFQF